MSDDTRLVPIRLVCADGRCADTDWPMDGILLPSIEIAFHPRVCVDFATMRPVHSGNDVRVFRPAGEVDGRMLYVEQDGHPTPRQIRAALSGPGEEDPSIWDPVVEE